MGWVYGGPNAEAESGLDERYDKTKRSVTEDVLQKKNSEIRKRLFQAEKDRADAALRLIMKR